MSAETVNPLAGEVMLLRALLADVNTAFIAAGWHEDQLVRRVKAAAHGGAVGVDKRAADLLVGMRAIMEKSHRYSLAEVRDILVEDKLVEEINAIAAGFCGETKPAPPASAP